VAFGLAEAEGDPIPAKEKADAFKAWRVDKNPLAIGFVDREGEFRVAVAINEAPWKIERDVKFVAAEQSHT